MVSIQTYALQIIFLFQCSCIDRGRGKDAAKLVRSLLKITNPADAFSADAERQGHIEHQIEHLLHEYNIIHRGSSESLSLVRGLAKRHGQSAIEFLVRSYGVATSQLLMQESQEDSRANQQLLRFIVILSAAVELWPKQERFRQMFALALCFGHAAWGGACELALIQWHWVAGAPRWQELLKRAAAEEGVEVPALNSFLFERLWLDAGAFDLFFNISGTDVPSRQWGAGLHCNLVKNVKKVLADDWAWYKKSRHLSIIPNHFQMHELEDQTFWKVAGMSIVRGVIPRSLCQKWLKYLRSLGNTSFSGLRYPDKASDLSELHVHEPLFRVARALDPTKKKIARILRTFLTSAQRPSLLNSTMHVQELGFFDIYKGAAAQGFHRDTYRDSAVHLQLALTESGECAPLEVVPGSHLVREASLCAACPKNKEVQGRRLRALLPNKATRLSTLGIGDVVAYDPRIYHRGASCDGDSHVAPRAVLWVSLSHGLSTENALERAKDLPQNPYLQALWQSGKVAPVADFLDANLKPEPFSSEL